MTTAIAAPARSEPSPAESVLMARVAAGDAEAFEAVYERHARSVYAYVIAQLDRSSEAEDVCQEAFLALWRHASRFDPRRGSVRGWLIGIARNQAIDRLRSRARQAKAEAGAVAIAALEPPEDSVSRTGADRAEAARLRRLLDDLPAEQRDVLLLVHHGGLSQREIAEVTGLPLGTVKSRLRLGLARVRVLAGADRPPGTIARTGGPGRAGDAASHVRPAAPRAGAPLPRPAGRSPRRSAAGRGAAA
jgi:RNA polymerase sigma-70 factor (ECF subfamily)